jgi:aminoglycoside 6-adenylyltransferase
MLGWHARAFKGPEYDTWLRGRFLEEWADPRAVEGLRNAFAHYDTKDAWRALFATMDLFRWLSLEAAGKLGFAYPLEGAGEAEKLSRQLYEQR